MNQDYVSPPGTPPFYRVDLRQLVLYLMQSRPAEQNEIKVAMLGERRLTIPPENGKPLVVGNLVFRRFVIANDLQYVRHSAVGGWAWELLEHPDGFDPQCLVRIGFEKTRDGRWFGIPTSKVLDAEDRLNAAMRELQDAHRALANAKALAAPTFSLDDPPTKS